MGFQNLIPIYYWHPNFIFDFLPNIYGDERYKDEFNLIVFHIMKIKALCNKLNIMMYFHRSIFTNNR